jgi:hypothetical protein
MRRIDTLSGSEMDSSTIQDLFSHPGADPRQWISYGVVQPDIEGGAHSVRFNDDSGNPLPQGVLIDVKLMPSGIICPCRVGMHEAGAGEAEYSPFGPGDEVLVAIPEGCERAGCVIISRLTNSLDVLPATVAANDITQNNISFKRTLTPFIHEVGGTYTIRSATTGATFAIGMQAPPSNPTALSGVALSDGIGNTMTMTPASGISFMTADGAQMSLAASLSLATPSTVAILTAGLNGSSTGSVHAIGVEQVCLLIEGFMSIWAAVLAVAVPTLGIGAQIAATLTPLLLPELMAGGIATAQALSLTVEQEAITGALTTTVPTPTMPGIGCLGLTFR